MKSRSTLFMAPTILLALIVSHPLSAELPDPDGKPADMSKPVQVYILLGQSNMVGAGKVGPADKEGSLEHAVKEKGKYPYLIDDEGNWTVRQDVRNVRVMGSGGGRCRNAGIQQRIHDGHRSFNRPGVRHRALSGRSR